MANIYTTAGKGLVANILDKTLTAPTNWFIGWGTGAGTAAIADTTLFTESTEARVAATMTQPSAGENQFVSTITAAAGKTITNAGVLTLITAGTLLIHSDFTGVVLASGDSIQFTFQFTQG